MRRRSSVDSSHASNLLKKEVETLPLHDEALQLLGNIGRRQGQ